MKSLEEKRDRLARNYWDEEKPYVPKECEASHQMRDFSAGWDAAVVEMQAENTKLREALQFYADKDNWKRWYSKDGEERRLHPTNTTVDNGYKAREALGMKWTVVTVLITLLFIRFGNIANAPVWM